MDTHTENKVVEEHRIAPLTKHKEGSNLTKKRMTKLLPLAVNIGGSHPQKTLNMTFDISKELEQTKPYKKDMRSPGTGKGLH